MIKSPQAFVATFLIFYLAALPTPDHCYDFAYPSFNDLCGSYHLTKLVGLDGSPDCSYTGCTFFSGSRLQGPLPPGLADTWTLSFWMKERMFSPANLFELKPLFSGGTLTMRLRLTNNSLKMDTHSLLIGSQWKSTQWVYIYAFSDAAANINGFGAYVQTVGAEKFEKIITGTNDLTQYEGKYRIRLSPVQSIQLLRKFLIFKGTAIHTSSLHTIEQVLAEVSCPALPAVVIPACTRTFFYYKMTPGQYASLNQDILDSSGNMLAGINGNSVADLVNDCSPTANGLLFDGTCFVTVSAVSPSRRGFSLQLELRPNNLITPTLMKVLDNATGATPFYVGVKPVNGEIEILVNSQTTTITGCLGLQTTTDIQAFCDYVVVQEIDTSDVLDFSGAPSFKIGEGFQGEIRHFKLFMANLGKETFSQSTILCLSNEYYDSGSTSCQSCDPSCGGCRGPTSTDCIACAPGNILITTSGTCVAACPAAAHFHDTVANACVQCSPTCADCNGPTQTDCLNCPTGLTLQADNSCACPSSLFFSISSESCQPCSSNCLSCDGTASTCTSCLPGQTLTNNQCFCPAGYLYDGISCNCFILTPDGECVNCGNGTIDAGQQCDDANLEDNDGCSSSCLLETGFLCSSATLPTRCSYIRTLAISEVSFTSTPSDITVTLHLSSSVYVTSLTLSDLSIITSLTTEPQISFKTLSSARFSSLSFTLDPQASVPSNSTIQVTIDSSQMVALDSSVTVPSSLTESSDLPSLDYLEPSVSFLSSSFDYVFQSLPLPSLVAGLLTQICLDISLEPLWVLFNTNQLLYFIPLLSISFPSNTIALFQILAFAHGDLLAVVLLYNLSFGYLLAPLESPSTQSQTPFTPNFLLLGYESNSLLDNCGIFFFLLSIQALLFLLFSLGNKLCCRCFRVTCLKCKRAMLCAPFIRTFLQGFLELTLCCCLAIYQTINGFQSISDIISSTFGFLTLAVALIIASKFMNVTAHSPNELSDSHSRVASIYSEAYSRLQINKGFLALNFFSWFLFRRFAIVIIIILFHHYPLVQIALHILLALLDIIILSCGKPFTSKFDLTFNLVNSIALLICYGIVLAIHLSSGHLWEILGWVLLSAILALNTFNILLLLSFKVCEIRTKIKEKKERLQREKQAKYKLQQFFAKHPQSSGVVSALKAKHSEGFSLKKEDPRFFCKAVRRENWGSQIALNKKSIIREEQVVQEIY